MIVCIDKKHNMIDIKESTENYTNLVRIRLDETLYFVNSKLVKRGTGCKSQDKITVNKLVDLFEELKELIKENA